VHGIIPSYRIKSHSADLGGSCQGEATQHGIKKLASGTTKLWQSQQCILPLRLREQQQSHLCQGGKGRQKEVHPPRSTLQLCTGNAAMTLVLLRQSFHSASLPMKFASCMCRWQTQLNLKSTSAMRAQIQASQLRLE